MAATPLSRIEVELESLPRPTLPRPHPLLRFWRRLAAFWWPVLALALGYELLLWQVGENWSIQRVMAYQAAHPGALWMRGFLDQDLYSYKQLNFERRRPRIIALGSSRVMGFRAGMFGPDSLRFYNLGGVLQNLGDLASFARLLSPTSAPRLIVLGVDMWWLNPNHRDREDYTRARHVNRGLRWPYHVAVLRTLVGSSRARQVLLAAATAPADRRARLIGVAARQHGFGFRADGSLDEGELVRPPDRPFDGRKGPPTVSSIRQGTERFPFAAGLSRARLDTLLAAVRLLRAKGSAVVVLLPPLWSGAARALASDPRQAGIWSEYRFLLPARLRAQGVPVLDGSTPAAVGLDDRCMFDGLHGGEAYYRAVLARLHALVPEGPRAMSLAPATRGARPPQPRVRQPSARPRARAA